MTSFSHTDPEHVAGGAIGPHQIVRRLALTSTCAIDHAVTRGPFGFERDVVLKSVAAGLDEAEAHHAATRLLHEAAALARLSHPAIVRLYELTSHAGSPVLVLEHVDGVSLAVLVDTLDANGEALDDACALYVGYRMASALAAAHGSCDPTSGEHAPIVHGDVSPGNVLIPWDGHVKLVDFELGACPGPGTPGFTAPERECGSPASVRSDVFSACAVLRELLLRAAFVGGTTAPLAKVRPDLHPALLELVERGLTFDARSRTVSANELVACLRALVDVESTRERLSRFVTSFAHRASQRETIAAPVSSSWDLDGETRDSLSSLRPTALSVVPPSLSLVRTVKTARRKKQRAERNAALIVGALVAVASAVVVVTRVRRGEEPTAPAEVARAAQSAAVPVVARGGVEVGVGVGVGVDANARADGTGDASAGAGAGADASAGAGANVSASAGAGAGVRADGGSDLESASAPGDGGSKPPRATGRILTDPTAGEHRVFVDGHSVGHGGATVIVSCGPHVVRTGSTGTSKTIDVPCGGDVLVAR